MPDRSDFWSRRRRAVARQEAHAVEASAAAESHAAAEAVEERSDAELLEFFGLPDPDTLTPADAARFMAREIPARLRRRAFRTLFQNHSHLSMPDGLQDYDHDYTDAAVNLRPAPTVWEGAKRAVDTVRQEVAGMMEEGPDDAPALLAEPKEASAGPDADVPIPATDDHASPQADPEEEVEAPRPRRMSFRFEGAGT